MRGIKCPTCGGSKSIEHHVAIVEGGHTKVPLGSFCTPCHTCCGTGMIYVVDAGDQVAVGHFPSGTEFRGSSGGYRPSLN